MKKNNRNSNLIFIIIVLIFLSTLIYFFVVKTIFKNLATDAVQQFQHETLKNKRDSLNIKDTILNIFEKVEKDLEDGKIDTLEY